MSKVLSWGRCEVTAKAIAETGYDGEETTIAFSTPVENSTSLETSQGDKVEAKVEGGGVEAVRFNANSYTLTFQERIGSKDEVKLKNHDGVVNGEFEVTVTPENSAAKKLKVNRASCNVGLSMTSADGIIATYTFSSLDGGPDEEQIELV